MSAHIEWLSAKYVDVDGASRPGEFYDDGNENAAAAIRITSRFDGDGVIIEGTPEHLVRLAQEVVATVRQVVEAVSRSDALPAHHGTSVEEIQALLEGNPWLQPAPGGLEDDDAP